MQSEMRLAVIITAAGLSERFRADAERAGLGPGLSGLRSKLDEDMGGRPVLHRAVELFTNRPETARIIVAGPHDEAAMDEFRLRHADKLAVYGVTLVAGGAHHRWQTVRNALGEIPDDGSITHVAVHDAARPGVPELMLDRVLDAALRHPAVIPALRVHDTVKRTEEVEAEAEADPLAAILGNGGNGDEDGGASKTETHVTETLDRSGLRLIQTPQVFGLSLLRRAYAQEDLSGTDDAQLVERLGERVRVVAGDLRAMKITTPGDLEALRAMLGHRSSQARAAHKRF
ncbi:MAG: 2-C-methyl-D-erythritol 4-phosphate cytidylyltransferase [Planctomycetota bacterium]